MIKPWVFEFFPTPHEPGAALDPQFSADYFNWYLDLWPTAEPLGYEGIFFGEHHFGAAYSPSPNLLIAQVAPRTKTIRLGVMGVVLPYHHPWKVVEEIGMLDHFTQGRLEIGTAAGIPQEMARVGLSVAEARERNDEAIEILDAVLAEAVVSHRSKYWSFDNLRLMPRPLQRPTPPKWVTVVSEDSARKSGAPRRQDLHLLPPDRPRHQHLRRLSRGGTARRQSGRARAAGAAPPGHAVAERRSGTRPVARQGRAVSRPDHGDPRVSAPGREVFETPNSHAFTIGSGEFIVGAPGRVADDIITQCRACGAGHFLAIFDRSAPRVQVGDAWAMFGAEVNPILRASAPNGW